MSTDEKIPPKKSTVENPDTHNHGDDQAPQSGLSRRDFIKTGAAGVAAGALAGYGLSASAQGRGADRGGPPRIPHGDLVLLKGGVVLTLDPLVGDFEKADVLIEGSKIVAVQPNIHAAAQVVDCRGMIVMPGFIDTHHHQYQTIQRAVIPTAS
jgi:imidazolonepropionase-like amidohydrolase